MPILARFAHGKSPRDLLLTTHRGAQLHRSAFIRTAQWDRLGRGRRIHDLRHSATCWWLSSGLPLHVVKGMAGHSSITTTERYLHFTGDQAAKAALARLDEAGGTARALSDWEKPDENGGRPA